MGHFFLVLCGWDKRLWRFAHSINSTIQICSICVLETDQTIGVICVDIVFFCASLFVVRSHVDLSASLLCALHNTQHIPTNEKDNKGVHRRVKKQHTRVKKALHRENHFDSQRPNWVKHTVEARTNAKSECVNSIVFGLSANSLIKNNYFVR